MSLDQQYYELLTRMDHPVFRKLFVDVTTFDDTTPFHSVFNLVLAKQLTKLKGLCDGLILDSQANTVREVTIDKWEETYFGFTKQNVPFLQRRDELLQRYNIDIGLAVQDVITLAESITGQTPVVIRNAFFGGWILDSPDTGVLDQSTVLPGDDQSDHAHLYIVIFSDPVPTELLTVFDNELTAIEKVGSRHSLVSPVKFWVLNSSALDLDTILG